MSSLRHIIRQENVSMTGSFFPRVTIHDGRAIERALAPANLYEESPRLDGAVVEATFAAIDPPLLRRIQEEGIPFFVDPQTIRFAVGTFTEVERIANLPYAPVGA